jgi:hypothetical protein
MRPESGNRVPLAWRRVPQEDAEIIVEPPGDERTAIHEHVLRDGSVLYPLHPLEAEKIAPDEVVHSGHIRFSASYRTVFYDPEAGGPLSTYCDDGQCLMIKLNLTESLPGIPGDRTLDRDTIVRCVDMGVTLDAELARNVPRSCLSIIREPFAVVVGRTGALFRPIPASGIVPLFSLFSGDADNEAGRSLLELEVRERYGEDAVACAERFGDDVAGPLVTALVDGFRCGFSLEMHAQNTLVSIGTDRLVDRTYFRDLEGALVSNSLRQRLGLEPVELAGRNVFGDRDDFPVARIFNRNLDHDLGRVFRGCLHALSRSGYFGSRECAIATSSMRRAIVTVLRDAALPFRGSGSRIMPLSRAPWGSGWRPGHWFRTEFR